MLDQKLIRENPTSVEESLSLRGKVFNISQIQELTIQNAKLKIRAFDYLGPAFLKYNNINLKILNYSEIEQGSSIELSDGLLYPLNVIPEGKSKMLFEDYLRGLK